MPATMKASPAISTALKRARDRARQLVGSGEKESREEPSEGEIKMLLTNSPRNDREDGAEEGKGTSQSKFHGRIEELEKEIDRLQQVNARLRSSAAEAEAEFFVKVKQESERRTHELRAEISRLQLVIAQKASERAEWDLKMQRVILDHTATLRDEVATLKQSLREYKVRAEAAEEALQRCAPSAADADGEEGVNRLLCLGDGRTEFENPDKSVVGAPPSTYLHAKHREMLTTFVPDDKVHLRLDMIEVNLSQLKMWAERNFAQLASGKKYPRDVSDLKHFSKEIDMKSELGLEDVYRVYGTLRSYLDKFETKVNARLHALDDKANYVYRKLKRLRKIRNGSMDSPSSQRNLTYV